jgi:hypothetical protein
MGQGWYSDSGMSMRSLLSSFHIPFLMFHHLPRLSVRVPVLYTCR